MTMNELTAWLVRELAVALDMPLEFRLGIPVR